MIGNVYIVRADFDKVMSFCSALRVLSCFEFSGDRLIDQTILARKLHCGGAREELNGRTPIDIILDSHTSLDRVNELARQKTGGEQGAA
jgi:hypothetical protein